MIINNNTLDNGVVFDVLLNTPYNKNNNVINIGKNIKLASDGVYIYITGNDKFQWPFISNASTITYNYVM